MGLEIPGKRQKTIFNHTLFETGSNIIFAAGRSLTFYPEECSIDFTFRAKLFRRMISTNPGLITMAIHMFCRQLTQD